MVTGALMCFLPMDMLAAPLFSPDHGWELEDPT
jgi:hypothetical protein